MQRITMTTLAALMACGMTNAALAATDAGSGAAAAPAGGPKAPPAMTTSKVPPPASGADEKNPGMDLAQATDLSRSALGHIGAASAALAAGNNKGADSELKEAAAILGQLYTAVPAGKMLAELGGGAPGKPMNLAPILTDVRSHATWVDPLVLTHLEEADKKQRSGDQSGATDRLLLARESLREDIALLPIEDAYARVQAAREELREGRPDRVQLLLNGVPVAIDQVRVTAPLVPVRFDLRAAAVAAESGDWKQSKELTDDATKALEKITKDAPANGAFDKEMKPIVARVQKLDERFAHGKKPQPGELREAAQKTRTVAKAP